jgi:glycosyltransferase involved in cell wall biosynthesis
MEDRWDGVLIRRYNPVSSRGYYRTWFVPDLAGADLVHLHGYAARTNDHVARRLRGVPLLFSLHHGVQMPHPPGLDRVLRRGYDLLVGFGTLRRVDRILPAYQGDADWLERHGFSSDRIRVLPTPLPDEAFVTGDPGWAQRRLGEAPFFLYLGRMHAEKGVDDLLGAYSRLDTKTKLVFAGPDAGAASALQHRAETLGLRGRTVFLATVSDEEKRSLLAACLSLVLPSFHEAQGLVVLEAWAQHRPVVTTRVGALTELVQDGSNGLLVDPASPEALSAALRAILNDPDRSKQLGTRGAETAARYRLSRLGPELDRICQEVSRQ